MVLVAGAVRGELPRTAKGVWNERLCIGIRRLVATRMKDMDGRLMIE